MIEKQLARIKSMGETYGAAKAGQNSDNTLAILTSAGPKLDTRMVKTVGFVRDAFVLEAMGEKMALVVYDNKPYLAALESTAGLYPGDKILPAPFYVVGALSVPVSDGQITLTCLQQVTQDEVRQAMGTKSESPASESVASASTSSAGGMATNKEAPSETASSAFDDAFSTPADGSRMWTSRNGHQIKGILLSKTATHVKLKRSDTGAVITVPIAQLSDADQGFLKK